MNCEINIKIKVSNFIDNNKIWDLQKFLGEVGKFFAVGF